MLAGRPVIAAAAGGALEIVESGKTGWLTPSGDAAKLAETITTAYCDPQLGQAIAQQGQAIAQERFNITSVNAQIDELLKVSIGYGWPSCL